MEPHYSCVLVVVYLVEVGLHHFDFAFDNDEDLVSKVPFSDDKLTSHLEFFLLAQVVELLRFFNRPVAHIRNLLQERDVFLQSERLVALQKSLKSVHLNRCEKAAG